MQKDYAQEYGKDIVEVRDFTLIIEKLPQSFAQYKDVLSLKFAIWDQIQKKVEACKQQGLCDEQIDTSIVDINIQTSDISFHQKQNEIRQTVQRIEVNYVRILNQMDNSAAEAGETSTVRNAKAKILKDVSKLQA